MIENQKKLISKHNDLFGSEKYAEVKCSFIRRRAARSQWAAIRSIIQNIKTERVEFTKYYENKSATEEGQSVQEVSERKKS